MFDGLKISCYVDSVEYNELINNEALAFFQSSNVATGELHQYQTLNAEYNALRFRLSPSTTQPNQYRFTIQGSIHKFYNDGVTNANDFTLHQYYEALKQVEALVKIPIERFKIEYIEFGVNIETPVTARKLLTYIICDGRRRFAPMSIDNVKLGLQVGGKNSDSDIKVYDKGKQANTNEKSLLRIEVKVKKMRYFNRFGEDGIKTITDTLNPEKVGLLGQYLARLWGEFVIYDNSINKADLTNNEHIKLLEYKNPNYWAEMDFRKRYNERAAFDALMKKYSPSTIQAEIQKAIIEKWFLLINKKHKNPGCLHPFLTQHEAHENRMFSPLEYTVKSSKNNPKKPIEKICKTEQKEPRFCSVCGCDISHLKKTALTCSRKCRNAKSNKARKERITEQRKKELELIPFVVEAMKQAPVKVSIEKNSCKRAKTQYTNTIKPMKYKERRKITRVRGSCGGVPFEFTKLRAKEFVKYCLTN